MAFYADADVVEVLDSRNYLDWSVLPPPTSFFCTTGGFSKPPPPPPSTTGLETGLVRTTTSTSSFPDQPRPWKRRIPSERARNRAGLDRNFAGFVLRRPATISGK
ncbi:unnamed protein product [Prunus armeniaca]